DGEKDHTYRLAAGRLSATRRVAQRQATARRPGPALPTPPRAPLAGPAATPIRPPPPAPPKGSVRQAAAMPTIRYCVDKLMATPNIVPRPKSVASHRKGGIDSDLWIGWVEPVC